METAAATRYKFDEFEIDAERRVLLKNGLTVALKPKAFDLLIALVENRGSIVSKNDLMNAVWANQFVEEKNLSVHIAALRKALGENKNENRFIATVPGTGYKFVAPLNDSGNEIVIESEKFERIVIEEVEIKKAEKNSGKRMLSWPLILSFAFLFLLAVVGFLWQGGRSQTGAANSIRRLTTNGKVQIAALSPDGKLFAYVTNDSGKTSLWLGYTAGGNHIQIRPPGETAYGQLIFSPDTKWLYFSMSDEQNPNTAVYRMPVFGSATDKLLDGIGSFSLSPDGTQAVFGREGSDGRVLLMAANLGDKTEREILSLPQSQTFVFGSVSWSPDGRRLALSCQRETKLYSQDLCLADVSGGKMERITLPNHRSILKTAWLKNNEGVIVTATPNENLSSVVNYQILHVELPGGNVREITNDLNTYNSDISVANDSATLLTIEHRQLNNIWVAPADNLSQAKQITFSSFGKYNGLWGLDWTPDGRIIFTSSNTETQLISVMNADGTGEQTLTTPGFVDSALAVSENGRYVVFHSTRGSGGVADIWRMDAGGGNLKQLTFENKNFQPSISTDNRFVYYKSWADDIGTLRRVSIDGGEPEVLTDKQTGWSTFSPDGKYFAATYRTDTLRLAIFSAADNQIVKQFDVPKTAAFDMRPRWTPDSSAVVYRDSESGYWSQSIQGGEARKLESLPPERLYTFAWSKDGKQFAFVRGQEIRDVVLFENFR